MELHTSWRTITGKTGTTAAYFVRPVKVTAPLPAVLLIHEAWGVDPHLEDIARRIAEAGYVVLAPDLLADGGERPSALSRERVEESKVLLDSLPVIAWMDAAKRNAAAEAVGGPKGQRLLETLTLLLPSTRPVERWTGLIADAHAHLANDPSVAGRKIGTVGFCLGGMLSGAFACIEPSLAAAVVFYGLLPAPERAGVIHCPVLGIFGENDPRIMASFAPFAEAMQKAGKPFASQVYKDTPHAFFNDTRTSYRVEAARDAWARVLTFLCTHLT